MSWTAQVPHDRGSVVVPLPALVQRMADKAFMLKALCTVARSRNMSQLAEETGMTRAGLYKALSGAGNPSLANAMKVAKALGFRLALVPDRD